MEKNFWGNPRDSAIIKAQNWFLRFEEDSAGRQLVFSPFSAVLHFDGSRMYGVTAEHQRRCSSAKCDCNCDDDEDDDYGLAMKNQCLWLFCFLPHLIDCLTNFPRPLDPSASFSAAFFFIVWRRTRARYAFGQANRNNRPRAIYLYIYIYVYWRYTSGVMTVAPWRINA